MATLKDVIEALNEHTKRRLMKRHSVDTQRKLVNHYDRSGGLKFLVRELNKQELCRSLTVLDKSELQAIVYGALAFDSKLEALIPEDETRELAQAEGNHGRTVRGMSTRSNSRNLMP